MFFGKLTAAIKELAVQVAFLVEWVKKLVGAITYLAAKLPSEPGEPTDPPTDPPDPDEPYVWDRNTPRATWPTKIGNLPVGYVRVKWEKSQLAIDDPVEGVIPSQVLERGKAGNMDSQRIIPAPGLVIMVRKDGSKYGNDGLEHILGAGNPAFACRPFALNGGVLGFWVMHEQNVGGHYIAEDPHRNNPLYVLAKDVIEFL